ncbi:MAG: hypothetical protein WCB93_09360 [Gallionella sp.]
MTTRKTIAAADRVTAKKSRAKKRAITVKPDAMPASESSAKKHKHNIKVVRDSFTMPENEYARIAAIKEICAKAKMHVKKSEVLRAGLTLLAELDPAQLKRALGSLEKIKTGRPKKH